MILDKLYSEFGKRIFFPQGIAFQANQAAKKADKINATVGLGRINGKPMHIDNVFASVNGLSEDEVFSYAPNIGDYELRTLWKEEMLKKNPSLKDKNISLPIVTSGLTHSISIVSKLFIDKDDTVLVGQPYWDNYKLIIETDCQAKIVGYDFFDLSDLKEKIPKSGPLKILINFPNNPTGWSPNLAWVKEFSDILLSIAESNRPVLAIFDDAYFGLNYNNEIFPESVFSVIANMHPNILAVKCDGATKEYLMWGFRIGFITFDIEDSILTNKIVGAIRSSVSSCSRIGQSLLIKALNNEQQTDMDRNRVLQTMKTRYNIVVDCLKGRPKDLLYPLPFNSGYFMTFKVIGGSSEELREYLLNQYGCGVICFEGYLRLAYCSLDEDEIRPAIGLIYKAARELWN